MLVKGFTGDDIAIDCNALCIQLLLLEHMKSGI